MQVIYYLVFTSANLEYLNVISFISSQLDVKKDIFFFKRVSRGFQLVLINPFLCKYRWWDRHWFSDNGTFRLFGFVMWFYPLTLTVTSIMSLLPRISSVQLRFTASSVLTGQIPSQTAKRCFPSFVCEEVWGKDANCIISFFASAYAQVETSSYLSEISKIVFNYTPLGSAFWMY